MTLLYHVNYLSFSLSIKYTTKKCAPLFYLLEFFFGGGAAAAVDGRRRGRRRLHHHRHCCCMYDIKNWIDL